MAKPDHAPLKLLTITTSMVLAVGCADGEGGNRGDGGVGDGGSTSEVTTTITTTDRLTTATTGDDESDGGEATGGQGGSGDDGSATDGEMGRSRHALFIQSNNPVGNTVLAFELERDGTLSIAPFAIYDTDGVGIDAGAEQRVGPLASDQSLVLTRDHNFLLAVNSGDNTIAVFETAANGELTALPGSPFDSGGRNPVSIGLVDDDKIVVAHKSVDGVVPPRYVTLRLGAHGTLAPIVNVAAVDTPIGGSPSIAYVTRDQGFVYGTQFYDAARIDQLNPEQIDAFSIGADGSLAPVPGAPYRLDLPPDTASDVPVVALNLIAHPTGEVLYVGLPYQGQVAVYDRNTASGELALAGLVQGSGRGTGWFLIDAEAERLFAVNTATATISIFDITEPREPVEIDSFELARATSGPPFIDANGEVQTITNKPCQLAFGPDQDRIYILSQRVTTNAFDPNGNYLHTLRVGVDSMLEPEPPIDLTNAGVPPMARPQGVVVF